MTSELLRTDANHRPKMVLAAALLGWLFDGFEMGLFPVIARPALQNLLASPGEAVISEWMGILTACFLVGAACGGFFFGWLGDKIGRVRALSASILCYSLVTGFGYFATSPEQLAALRFIAALGMGGEWALGVALVMEVWSDKHRPLLAGVIGASANVGFFLVAYVTWLFPVTPASWRWMLLVGVLPALLVFFIRLYVPESRRWQQAVQAQPSRPLREIFGRVYYARTLLGIGLASVALIGTWASVEWLPVWADQMVAGKDPSAKSTTQMLRSTGSLFGCLIGPLVGAWIGRRPGYAVLCLVALGISAVFFRTIDSYGPAFLVFTVLMGAASTSFYGLFPLYFAELFPTRIRATGQGVCYNTGRIFAAVGALYSGYVFAQFGGYPQTFAVITLIYGLGLFLVFFAPETKGQKLQD
jgi:SHS family sialic acid transporter-like MFS transporter